MPLQVAKGATYTGLGGGIDLLGNRIEIDWHRLSGGLVSALRKAQATAGLVVLGDLNIKGHIKAIHTLAEPLQIVMENGTRRALMPVENKRNFMEVSADIIERVDSAFYSDPRAACTKALG